MMIEIAIHDIANYDMVQFEQALAGEKVVLTHNGKAINMTPNKNDIINNKTTINNKIIKHDTTVHLADLF